MKPVEHWLKRPEIAQAALKGWNATKRIPELLKEEYPEFRPYNFAFFTQHDVPHRISIGYEFLMTSDFPDWETLSDALPLRFSIRPDAEGKIKYKDLYIMYMPSDHRKRMRKLINDAAERRVSLSPGDVKRGDQLTEGYAVVESAVDMNEPNAKRGPGRPKKDK